jgi:hypothetical protein
MRSDPVLADRTKFGRAPTIDEHDRGQQTMSGTTVTTVPSGVSVTPSENRLRDAIDGFENA